MGAYRRLLLLAIPIVLSGVIAGCNNSPGGVGTPGNGAAGAQPPVVSTSGGGNSAGGNAGGGSGTNAGGGSGGGGGTGQGGGGGGGAPITIPGIILNQNLPAINGAGQAWQWLHDHCGDSLCDVKIVIVGGNSDPSTTLLCDTDPASDANNNVTVREGGTLTINAYSAPGDPCPDPSGPAVPYTSQPPVNPDNGASPSGISGS